MSTPTGGLDKMSSSRRRRLDCWSVRSWGSFLCCLPPNSSKEPFCGTGTSNSKLTEVFCSATLTSWLVQIAESCKELPVGLEVNTLHAEKPHDFTNNFCTKITRPPWTLNPGFSNPVTRTSDNSTLKNFVYFLVYGPYCREPKPYYGATKTSWTSFILIVLYLSFCRTVQLCFLFKEGGGGGGGDCLWGESLFRRPLQLLQLRPILVRFSRIVPLYVCA